MRKIWPLLFAILMLGGCGTDRPTETTPFERTTPSFVITAPTEPTEHLPQKPEKLKSGEIEVLRCSFQERILPGDHEVFVGCFPDEPGKVYVDLVLRVRNTCDLSINHKDISGYFEYAGKQYTMQFEVEENAGDFANSGKQIRPGETKTVHLFYVVDQAAVDTEITVHYTALDQSGEVTVEEQIEPEKKLLKVGDIFLQEGQYSVEILNCEITSWLQATGVGAMQYFVDGSDVFCLTVKVRNLGYGDLDYIEGYLLAGEQPEFSAVQYEVNDNTELVDWNGRIRHGQAEILHLWVAVPQDMPSAGMVMRLNIQNDSFCCETIA